jgi:branched-chain amino acid aminotransferase
MMVFLNGEFVPEERAVVSVFDRGFRYGDGVFEAVLVSNRKLFLWEQHCARLRRSAEFIRLKVPFTNDALHDATTQLFSRNQHTEAMVRITVSRGVGARGYAPKGDEKPTLVITTHPLPAPEDRAWKVIVSSLRIAAHDLVPQHKTANRLVNVLAAAEAQERGADDALLVNTEGHVTEGTSSNVFWTKDGLVHTPPAEDGLLPGVTRAVVFDLCRAIGMPVMETSADINALKKADGVFLTLTSRGVVEVAELDGELLSRSPLVATLAAEYRARVRRECA